MFLQEIQVLFWSNFVAQEQVLEEIDQIQEVSGNHVVSERGYATFQKSLEVLSEARSSQENEIQKIGFFEEMINSGAIKHLSSTSINIFDEFTIGELVKFEIYGPKNEYLALLDKTGLFILTKNKKNLFEEEKIYNFLSLKNTNLDQIVLFSKHLGHIKFIDIHTGIIVNEINSKNEKNENLEFSFLEGVTSY